MSKTYTYDEISHAVNEGADLVHGELSLDDRDYDLIGLIVNSAMAALDRPGIGLDEVIEENYDDGPEDVRGWWDW
ncbi:hypothetical protein [Streptomyces sp. NPDC014733]|uniref:hypothetical protein n=1 Tax=Streptomyces sp. NPDC014733 TaxID=3364885 RepID=UPI0036F61FEE